MDNLNIFNTKQNYSSFLNKNSEPEFSKREYCPPISNPLILPSHCFLPMEVLFDVHALKWNIWDRLVFNGRLWRIVNISKFYSSNELANVYNFMY